MEESSRFSAPFILLIEFLFALCLAVYFLYRYGDLRRQNPFVTICTLVVWFLSFVIIFLLPVDVSSAFYQLCLQRPLPTSSPPGSELEIASGRVPSVTNCDGFVCSNSTLLILQNNSQACSHCLQPYTFICPLPLKILWNIIYWLFFLLSWIVLPLGQSYVLASYFSIWKKILRALLENALFYVTFFVIFVVLFIYLVVVEKIIALENLPSLLATASNTWGLLILTLLLGYGLVEIPRSMWNASRRRYTLNHCYFKAAKLYTDMAEADEKLSEAEERVGQVAQSLHYNDPLRKYIDIIIKKFPKDRKKEFSRGHDDYEDYQSSQDPLSKSSLEGLLKKTMKAVRLFNSSRIQWLALTDQSLDLEDIQTNSTSPIRRFKSSIRPEPQKERFYHVILETIEWYWKLWVQPWAYRIGAVLLGLLSVLIVWCEITFGIYVNSTVHLSIFAEIIYVLNKQGNSIIAVEALSIGIVAYLSICAYFTVFRIRIFNLYNIAPNHSTDEYSLLFSAVLLSRLALPICLNYLYMIQVVELAQHDNDTLTPQTAFAIATGNTDLIPWLTSYFYIYYPMLIILVCIATIFSLGTRLVSLLGYQKFIGEDDFSADFIDEGKTLMKRERRIRERNLREHGKQKNRDQLPFELLRESAAASNRRGINRFSQRRSERDSTISRNQDPVEEEDRSRMSQVFGRVKTYASKGKDAVATKYRSTKVAFWKKDGDDGIELLASKSDSDASSRSNGASGSGHGYRGAGSRAPPKDLFEDL